MTETVSTVEAAVDRAIARVGKTGIDGAAGVG